MNGADIPTWSAWVVVILALAGAGFSLVGAIGLVRFKTFYERVHAPTLGATLGTSLVLCSSVILLSLIEGRLVLRDILIGVFLTVTTPVTLVILARAAAHRDRQAGDLQAPPSL